MNDLKIAFFDSGIGGLSVLKRALDLYPYEKYLYYADTLNAPYGNLSKEKIYRLTYLSVEKLVKTGIKALVIACNTATNAGVVKLREAFNLEIIGIEPALKPAVEKIKSGNILVLGTYAALRQEKFKTLYEKYDNKNIILSPQSDLASDIENHYFDRDFLYQKLERVFKEYRNFDIKGIVLGCTHYSLVKDLILKMFENAEIFDGNTGTAINLFRKLRDKNLISPNKEQSIEIFTSCGLESKKEQYLKILNSLHNSYWKKIVFVL